MLADDLPYEVRQEAYDRNYLEEWEKAPESFKRKAAELGLEPSISKDSMAMEFDDNRNPSVYEPEITDVIDTYIDYLTERYGIEHEVVLRKMAADLQEPMKLEIERQRDALLCKLAGLLINSENKNIGATIHAFAHSIPRFAKENNIPSMRQSAKQCGCSPQWIKKARDGICKSLGLEPPSEGVKSETAKRKYRLNGIVNHWRKQKVTQPK